MDPLTVLTGVLGYIATIAKAITAVLAVIGIYILIRLLPRRIRNFFGAIAAWTLFYTLFKSNCYDEYAFALILGRALIPMLPRILGAILPAALVAFALSRDLPQGKGERVTPSVSRLRDVLRKNGETASFLSRSPVMTQ